MEREGEIGSSSKLDRFRSALSALQLLGQKDIDQLFSQLLADPDRSPVSALIESGRCSPSDAELVSLWMEAESAIPGYELIDLIGRGGMGVVWRARQTSLNRIVALKMTSASQDTNKTLVARFEREAIAISKLSHPNIVTALDFGRFGNRLFLAMEYVAGKDLGLYVEQNGKLSELFALKLVRQIAAGLSHASRNGIIHRDIKPANVLLVQHLDSDLTPHGSYLAKITDFGLAILNETQQTPEARLTTEQSTIGSPHYMAPDQLNGTLLDTRADIYSLGATLFHLLTGRAPWSGRPLGVILREKLTGQFPIVELEVAGVSLGTKALVERMTANDPTRRPSSYQELLAEVDRLIELRSQTLKDHENSSQESAETESSSHSSILSHASSVTHRDMQTTRVVAAGIETGSHGSLDSGPRTPSPLRVSTTDLSRTNNWKWYAAITSLLVIAFTALTLTWWLQKSGTVEPIDLVMAGEQRSLFDGINISLGTISEGELELKPGQIELGGSKVSILGFVMPQWDFFKFEASVALPDQLTLDVAVGEKIYSDRRQCSAVRFHENEAQSGSLTRVGGDFLPDGNRQPLDAGRHRHYLELERNQGIYVVRIDRNREGQFILPMEQGRQQELEILIVVQKNEPNSGGNSNANGSRAAISEITVSKMRPDKQPGVSKDSN